MCYWPTPGSAVDSQLPAVIPFTVASAAESCITQSKSFLERSKYNDWLHQRYKAHLAYCRTLSWMFTAEPSMGLDKVLWACDIVWPSSLSSSPLFSFLPQVWIPNHNQSILHIPFHCLFPQNLTCDRCVSRVIFFSCFILGKQTVYYKLRVCFKCNSFRLLIKCNVFEKWQIFSDLGKAFGGSFLWVTWIGIKKSFSTLCCNFWIYQFDIINNNAHDKESMSSFSSSFPEKREKGLCW